MYSKQEVRVIAKSTLRNFWEKHADTEQQLKAWFNEMAKTDWTSFNQLKTEFPSASILPGGRVVFNIKGNSYHLIAKFNFDYAICWIRFIGTHADYDKVDAKTI